MNILLSTLFLVLGILSSWSAHTRIEKKWLNFLFDGVACYFLLRAAKMIFPEFLISEDLASTLDWVLFIICIFGWLGLKSQFERMREA